MKTYFDVDSYHRKTFKCCELCAKLTKFRQLSFSILVHVFCTLYGGHSGLYRTATIDRGLRAITSISPGTFCNTSVYHEKANVSNSTSYHMYFA